MSTEVQKNINRVDNYTKQRQTLQNELVQQGGKPVSIPLGGEVDEKILESVDKGERAVTGNVEKDKEILQNPQIKQIAEERGLIKSGRSETGTTTTNTNKGKNEEDNKTKTNK